MPCTCVWEIKTACCSFLFRMERPPRLLKNPYPFPPPGVDPPPGFPPGRRVVQGEVVDPPWPMPQRQPPLPPGQSPLPSGSPPEPARSLSRALSDDSDFDDDFN